MSDPIDSIRYPFALEAGAGRLAHERDYPAHVEQMMKQLLLTNPGERINLPDFGCGVRRMVFAPNSDVSAHLLKVTIVQALDQWMSTIIDTNDVQVEVSDEKLSVSVSYVLKARGERRYLNLEVTL